MPRPGLESNDWGGVSVEIPPGFYPGLHTWRCITHHDKLARSYRPPSRGR